MLFREVKLARELGGLSANEFRSLGKWLNSPWCNTNKKLFLLYQVIKAQFPDFQSQKLTLEFLFKKLYPDRPYQQASIRNVMSSFQKQLEAFLTFQRFRKDRFLQKKIFLEDLMERHRYRTFMKEGNRLVEDIAKTEPKSEEDYYHLATIYKKLYYHSEVDRGKNTDVLFLRMTNQFIDKYYLLEKSRILCEENERKQFVINANNSKDVTEYLAMLLEKYHDPAAKFYRKYLLQAQGLVALPVLRQLKRLFLDSLFFLSREDQKRVLLVLINHAARLKLQTGQDSLWDVFELYQAGLEHDILFHNGRMTESTFANIVTVGNLVGQHEYVQGFIENFAVRLPDSSREDAIWWAKAHTIYSLGDVQTCLSYIAKQPFKSSFLTLRSKVLEMQAHLENFMETSRDSEYLHYYASAFKKYIARNQVLNRKKKASYLNFIYFVERLIEAFILPVDRIKQLKQLEEQINQEKNLHARAWLLDKVDSLK